MFKNLRTSRKLILLCAMFIISIAATTYYLVAEKRIAINFALKELVGTQYLAAIKNIYAAVLARPPIEMVAAAPDKKPDDPLSTLANAQSQAGGKLRTAEAAGMFAGALQQWINNPDGAADYAALRDVMAKGRQLVARIADESNLALDPQIDSYYVQDLLTTKFPEYFRQLSELQILSRMSAAGSPSAEQKVRFEVQSGLLRSTMSMVTENLGAAYRGSPDGSLKQAIDGPFAAALSSANGYLDALSAGVENNSTGRNTNDADRLYGKVVESAVGAWTAAQGELERLLHGRIDSLVRNLALSLALIGALTCLSIVVAVITRHHTVEPLERLEALATTVRETKDYSLRSDYASNNEIGRLATAFNDMLAELASARERERAKQSEFMRDARMTTMGAMTASIAHEINQPLGAIVANSDAAQRWLTNPQPNLDEAMIALKSISSDGHRASQVIGSVRSMFKKDSGGKTPVAVNDVIEDTLILVDGEIQKRRVLVRAELLQDLPTVTGDRTQMLQVFMNLIRNAVDAMESVTDRERLLTIKSHIPERGSVMVTVKDSGTGIDADTMPRIFETFYTTKSDGMGMGLSICRSIIEAHGGRLWVSPGVPHGSSFHVVLPCNMQ